MGTQIDLIFLISKGEKQSRFLVNVEKENKSFLIDNSKNPEVGKTLNIQDGKLEDAKPGWVDKYNAYCRSTQNLKKHMIKYKKSCFLKDLPWGFWNGKEYEHILPCNKLNLINSFYYKDLIDYYSVIENKREIHRGFANLNSSQAFALNFFVPIIKENLFSELLDIPKSEQIRNACFEKKLNKAEGTQLDFYLKTTKDVFTFEVKYSENAFGDAEDNEDHSIKYDKNYKERLDKIVENLSKEGFFEEYQLWRNICFSGEEKNVYFVFPRFRNDLTAKVEAAKNKCKEKYQDKIKILYVDDFVNKMRNSENENLRDHYSEFYKKYLDVLKE